MDKFLHLLSGFSMHPYVVMLSEAKHLKEILRLRLRMTARVYNLKVLVAVFILLVGGQLVWANVETPHQQEFTPVIPGEENLSFELDNALEANPYDAESHVRLGRIYYEKGLFDRTIYEFLKASEIDPSCTEIYAMLSTLLGKEKITADTYKEPLRADFSSAKAQENAEVSSPEQIYVKGAISSKGTVREGSSTDLDGQAETADIPDALSKTTKAMDGNASNDNFIQQEVELESLTKAVKILKATAGHKETKITFFGKHFSLIKDVINQTKEKMFGREEAKGYGRLHMFIIRILTFVTAGLAAYTAFNLLPVKASPTKERLMRLQFAGTTRSSKKSLSQAKRKEANFLKERLYALGQLIVPRGEEARNKMKMELLRAGYRRSDAVSLYSGIKVLLALTFLAGFVAVGITMKITPSYLVFFGPATAGLGMYLPILWVRYKTKKRKTAILSAFPDALDLLAVCVDAGLGLDAAIVRVSDEIRIANKELSEELQLLNLEIRAGKPRPEALHNLGQRTDIEDIQSLVAMLIQADRFGTSIANSLRVHSDAARTKRRLKAEEMAAKTTVKMVFPLLLFILPALFVIVMAPAVLQIINNMGGVK